MGLKVLALIESNIGMRYTLDTRLTALGFQVTILTAPAAFEERLASEAFDWIILDAVALRPLGRRFLDHLRRHRKEARVVWCGKSPRWTSVPLEATFEKPLRYNEIERFFSQWTSDFGAARNAREAIPWKPVDKPMGRCQGAQEAQQAPAETGGKDEMRGTGGAKQS
jgi:hypothetical protein